MWNLHCPPEDMLDEMATFCGIPPGDFHLEPGPTSPDSVRSFVLGYVFALLQGAPVEAREKLASMYSLPMEQASPMMVSKLILEKEGGDLRKVLFLLHLVGQSTSVHMKLGLDSAPLQQGGGEEGPVRQNEQMEDQGRATYADVVVREGPNGGPSAQPQKGNGGGKKPKAVNSNGGRSLQKNLVNQQRAVGDMGEHVLVDLEEEVWQVVEKPVKEKGDKRGGRRRDTPLPTVLFTEREEYLIRDIVSSTNKDSLLQQGREELLKLMRNEQNAQQKYLWWLRTTSRDKDRRIQREAPQVRKDSFENRIVPLLEMSGMAAVAFSCWPSEKMEFAHSALKSMIAHCENYYATTLRGHCVASIASHYSVVDKRHTHFVVLKVDPERLGESAEGGTLVDREADLFSRPDDATAPEDRGDPDGAESVSGQGSTASEQPEAGVGVRAPHRGRDKGGSSSPLVENALAASRPFTRLAALEVESSQNENSSGGKKS